MIEANSCGYCGWEIYKESELPCGHEVHSQCFEAFVSEKSDNTFDPAVKFIFISDTISHNLSNL
jgi:hypothetical protein